MMIRVSFLVVASSFAAVKISQTKTSSPTKRNGTMKSTGCDASHLGHEFEEMENSNANATHVIQNEEKHLKIEMPQNLVTGDLEEFELLIHGEKMDDSTQKELLQNLVQNYKEREVNLERKLLELNRLKEEQSAIAQLQRQLENKTAKLDSLKVTIASLQAENKIIRGKIREDALSKKHLDIAKKMINEMQRKKNVNGSNFKEQILMLQQQVTELHKYNSSARDALVNKKLKDVQGVELEALELKRRNKELELEKREIGAKLATAQAKVTTEEETVAIIKEEMTGLRHVHEELLEQVEILQRNRFEMVQELVYQRWLFTCLRFEAHHNHQKRNREAPRQDCCQNSSKEELYGKAHALTYDPELDSNSSIATTSDESDGTETTTLESSSSSQSSSSKNSSLLSKMKRWRKTKHDSKENIISSKGRIRTISSPSSPGLTQRFSMPMVLPSDPSMPLSRKISSTKSLEKPMLPRLKRVSFSDCSVKPSTYQDISEAVEEVTDDKETRPEHQQEFGAVVSELYSHGEKQDSNSQEGNCWENLATATVSDGRDILNTKKETRPEHEAEQYHKPSNSNESTVGNLIKDDTIDENEGAKSEIGGSDELHSRHELVCGKDDRIKTQLVQLVALFFFSLILLAYLRIK